jgi:hypothetical protein
MEVHTRSVGAEVTANHQMNIHPHYENGKENYEFRTGFFVHKVRGLSFLVTGWCVCNTRRSLV